MYSHPNTGVLQVSRKNCMIAAGLRKHFVNNSEEKQIHLRRVLKGGQYFSKCIF